MIKICHSALAAITAFFLFGYSSPGGQLADCMAAEFTKSHSVVPIPPQEKGVEAVDAELARIVGNNGQTLEGALFSPDGDLYFCNVSDRKVMRLGADGTLSTVLEVREFAPGGLAWCKDGRLFISGIDQPSGTGCIIAFSPESGKRETIISADAGFMPNDLVFDNAGGFYFTDFSGSATVPSGGVYYMGPDFAKITPVIPAMAQANGVALSPDGKTLWATEYANNRLHRVNLNGPAEVPLTGSKILYHFTGPAPDSMRVDADGNVYVALVGQGRVLVFNPAGIPIGQVLLPGRDKGLNLRSTSLGLHPERAEMVVVAGNTADAGSTDAAIFRAPAFAKSQPQDINMHRNGFPGMVAKVPMQPDGIVRLSQIEVDPAQLEEYIKYATEVGETSLRKEPGVLAMYAVSQKDQPNLVTILEIYASQDAYKAHIASEHFQKYKKGTIDMVKSLKLLDQNVLNPANVISNFIIDSNTAAITHPMTGKE